MLHDHVFRSDADLRSLKRPSQITAPCAKVALRVVRKAAFIAATKASTRDENRDAVRGIYERRRSQIETQATTCEPRDRPGDI